MVVRTVALLAALAMAAPAFGALTAAEDTTKQTARQLVQTPARDTGGFLASRNQGNKESADSVNQSPDLPQEAPIVRYTLWQTVFSGLLVLTSVVSIWVSIRAIGAANKSNRIAQGAASAANESARIAAQALAIGERAFVSLRHVVPSVVANNAGVPSGWRFMPVWTNTGNTPTRDMRNYVNIKVFEGEPPEDYDFADLPAPDASVIIPLGPKSDHNGGSGVVSRNDLNDVITGKKSLLFYGRACYNDAFPDTARHITRFALRIAVGGDVLKPTFDYPLWPRHNCFDEDCDRQGYSAGRKPQDADA
jgi:hypothetical protein